MIKPLGDAPDHWRVMNAYSKSLTPFPKTAEIAALTPDPESSLDFLCKNEYLQRIGNDRWTHCPRARFIEIDFYQTIWPNVTNIEVSVAINMARFVEEHGCAFKKDIIHRNNEMRLEIFNLLLSEDDFVLWKLWYSDYNMRYL